MPLTPGQQLGSYEILAPLGAGGMGEVYRARDNKLNREVAIKVLPATLANDADYLARFQREAQALAALHHPNIATIFGLEQNAIVMELIDGQPLQGPKPIDEVRNIGKQIAEALEAAHEKGIVHRDLKPGNILLTAEGQVKILDFGLAKAVESAKPTGPNSPTLTMRATEAGLILGTAGYMSPEQAAGKPVDRRADIWSFGVVLYELLTGKRLFDGETVSHTLAEVLKTEIDFAPIPAGPVRDLLQRCLDRNIKTRLQHIGEARIALETYKAPAPQNPAAKVSWLPWAIAAATLVIGVLAGWGLTRSQPVPVRNQVLRTALNPPENTQFDFENGFAFSPDGRTIVFSANGPGQRGLWVRQLDGTSARLLPGTEGATDPFWSPDGRAVAYWKAKKLWRIDVGAGAPIAVCEANFLFRGGAWAPDGTLLFGMIGTGLLRVPAAGGTPVAFTTPDRTRGELDHRLPQLLPGGRILFLMVGKAEVQGTYLTELNNPAKRVRVTTTLYHAHYSSGHLLFVRGSTLMAQRFDPERAQLSGEPSPLADLVGRSQSGWNLVAPAPDGILVHAQGTSSRLVWLDRDAKTLGPLSRAASQPADYFTFRISPDQRKLLAGGDAQGGVRPIWMLDLERDVWSRFTFLPGFSSFPVWSPDGRRVFFRSGSPQNLYLKDASGTGTEQRLSESPNTQTPGDWSRDGRYILYWEQSPETQRDIWVIPMTPDGKPVAGEKPRPYLRTAFNEHHARFSPETSPRWVAYTSDESGRDEVYVQAFPEPRAKVQISSAGGSYPEWSADGRELYYVSAENKLIAVTVKATADAVIPTTSKELFAIPPSRGTAIYTAAPDGKRFLVNLPANESRPLDVIVNWPALLKNGAQ